MVTDRALKTVMDELRRAIDMQAILIQGLRQDNRDLLNRLMVKNMQEYAMTSPASVAEMNFPPAEKLAKEDNFGREFLAGEVIEDAS